MPTVCGYHDLTDTDHRLVPPEREEKWFCGECGPANYGSNPSHPESVGIRMGTFDSGPGIRTTVRQFVAYAAPWEPVPDDGLPRFPESRHAPGARLL